MKEVAINSNIVSHFFHFRPDNDWSISRNFGKLFIQYVLFCNHMKYSIVQVLLKSEDYGKHLLGVQDLLQKHTLSEADITAQRERARALEAQVQKFVEEKHPESAKIVQKSGELDAACQRLQSLSATRLARLKVQREEWRDTHTSACRPFNGI